jgi:hypothetical protein
VIAIQEIDSQGDNTCGENIENDRHAEEMRRAFKHAPNPGASLSDRMVSRDLALSSCFSMNYLTVDFHRFQAVKKDLLKSQPIDPLAM